MFTEFLFGFFFTYLTPTFAYLQIGDFCPTSLDQLKKPFENLSQCNPSVPLDCVKGRCECKRGYTINRNGTQCLEVSRNGLESPCEESIQCWKGLLGRLSECNLNINKCSCYESETIPIVFHQGRCYYGESLGDYCQIDGLCSATTPNAACKLGTCQCTEGYVASWDKSRCLTVPTHGLDSPCEENIQCEKSPLGTLSECNQELMRCQCYQIPMVTTVFHMGRCYFGASLGDVCQVTGQCLATTENTVCGADGKCRCDETVGFVPNALATQCLPVASADDSSTAECSEDVQCTQTLGHFSRCRDQRCECFLPEDSTPMVIVGAKCVTAKSLGDSCKYHQQCAVLVEKALCLNDTCQCPTETHVTSGDTKRCLPIADGLGSSCVEDEQCTWSILGPLSQCLEENCSCASALPVVYYNKACYFHRHLGTPCESDSECKAGGNSLAECDDGRCQCGRGLEMDGQTCMPVTHESKSDVTSVKACLHGSAATIMLARILY